jgi:outer membrane protein assembly factor BamB
MPRDPRHQLFVGIKNSVVALDVRDGTELWRTKLGGYWMPNVFWDGEQLFASAKGEVFCLDPRDGAVLWNSPLKGLGTSMATFASTRRPGDSQSQSVLAEKARQAAQASHGAAT